MRRLTIQAPVDSFTSYGITFQKIFFSLQARGIYVSVRPTKIQTPFGTTIPPEIMACIVTGPQPEEWEVLFGPPIHLPTPGKKVFYWTTHEEPEFPKQMRELLSTSKVIARMNRPPGHLKDFGLKACPPSARLEYLPLGVDLKVFQPSQIPKSKMFTFGTAGRLAHGKARKGVDTVIKAFLAEFHEGDAARLVVKVHPDCDLEPVDDKRVRIIREHLPEGQVVEWLQSLHCYVSGATYEGFGLWPLQAMAVGRPVIAKANSGCDYLHKLNCLFWDNELQIAENMRRVYEDSKLQYDLARQGWATAQSWPLEATVNQFVKKLEHCGALEKESFLSYWKRCAKALIPQQFTNVTETDRIVHIYPSYQCSEADQNRIDLARKTWEPHGLVDCPVANSMLPREFRDENRALPYVKDLIDHAAAQVGSGDIILLTNTDICFAPCFREILLRALKDLPAVMCPRREFERLVKPATEDQISEATRHPGWDAFAFRKRWWTEHRNHMPDMLFGAEGWDSVLRALIEPDEGSLLDRAVYHVAHVPFWKEHRFTISSQKYNRALARKFFKREALPCPIDPDPPSERAKNLI